MGLLTVEDRYPWVPQLKSKSWRFLNRQHQQQNDVARALVDQQDLCVDSLAVLEWSSSHLGKLKKKAKNQKIFLKKIGKKLGKL